MDDHRQLKRMLNEVLIRARTLIAEIGIASDEVIMARHHHNNSRLCGILDICDYDLDRTSNTRIQSILDDFFADYEESFMVLDKFSICVDCNESRPHGK